MDCIESEQRRAFAEARLCTLRPQLDQICTAPLAEKLDMSAACSANDGNARNNCGDEDIDYLNLVNEAREVVSGCVRSFEQAWNASWMESWQRIRDGIAPLVQRLESQCLLLFKDTASFQSRSCKALVKSLAVEVGDRVEVLYKDWSDGKDRKLEAYEEKDWYRGKVVGVEGLMTNKSEYQVKYDQYPDACDEEVAFDTFRRLPSRLVKAPSLSALTPPRHLSSIPMHGSAHLAAEAVELELLVLEQLLKTFHVCKDPQRAPANVESVMEDLAKALWELRGRTVGLWPDMDLMAGQKIALAFGRGQEPRVCSVKEVKEEILVLYDNTHGIDIQVPRQEWPHRVVLQSWPGINPFDSDNEKGIKGRGKKRGPSASSATNSPMIKRQRKK